MHVLTINSHESYISGLGRIDDIELTIIDQMPGRYTDKWDERVRPIPENAHLITMPEAMERRGSYDVIIAHNLTDLQDTRSFKLPAVLMIHSSLDGLLASQETSYGREDIHKVLQTYLNMLPIVPVSISRNKAISWGIHDCRIIPSHVDTDFFDGYTGDLPKGLRVANQFMEKGDVLNLDFHNQLVDGIEWDLVGHNPSLNIEAAPDIEALRDHYRNHRYYIHTAAEGFEDGYNLASLEAMSTGMPIICNAHPTSAVVNGETGFVSDDVEYLREQIRRLELDIELARSLGVRARQYALKNHSFERFRQLWLEALAEAMSKPGKS